jgi:hypothetical protein
VRAREALDHFHRIYLPEHPPTLETDLSEETRRVYDIEDGWLGMRLKEKTLALIFECPDQETARTIVDQIQ